MEEGVSVGFLAVVTASGQMCSSGTLSHSQPALAIGSDKPHTAAQKPDSPFSFSKNYILLSPLPSSKPPSSTSDITPLACWEQKAQR